jgi:ATP-dependent DNA helicase RecQ
MREHHKRIKTYGVGADLSRKEWLDYLREIMAQGYLEQTADQYPVLKLGQGAKSVLTGGTRVMLRKREEPANLASRAGGAKAREEEQRDYPRDLFELLRQARRQLAEDADVPPYQVLSDSSLIDLACKLPADSESLIDVSGFGEKKIEFFGDAFLSVVKQWCKEQGIAPKKLRVPTRKDRSKKSKSRLTSTARQSFELFRAGHSLEEIAQERGIQDRTVAGHLADAVIAGKIDLEEMVAPDRVEAIEQTARQVGSAFLKPIKEALPEDYDYNEIRMVVESLRARDQNNTPEE